MTLTEIMVAMTILVVLAGGIISGVFVVRADAENNLYESAALNVAISFLEQTKAEVYEDLANPPLNADGKKYVTYIVGFKEYLDLPLNEDVTLDVPIISNEDGSSKKTLPVTVNVSLIEGTSINGYWIEVEYSWTHPTNARVYGGEVRGFRSLVSTY